MVIYGQVLCTDVLIVNNESFGDIVAVSDHFCQISNPMTVYFTGPNIVTVPITGPNPMTVPITGTILSNNPRIEEASGSLYPDILHNVIFPAGNVAYYVSF